MAAAQGLRVLLVEDNPADARMVELQLDSGPIKFAVTTVGSLEAALEAASHRYAVVLLDLNLPDSTGLDTARRFHQGHPTLPLVVVTGSDDAEEGLEAMRIGVHDYIAKNDMELESLERRMMFAIERARLQRRPDAARGSLSLVRFDDADHPAARQAAYQDATGAAVLAVSLVDPHAVVRAELAAAGFDPVSTYIVCRAAERASGLDFDQLVESQGWEDLAIAVERGCRRLGTPCGVVVDSWSALEEAYGVEAAKAFVKTLAYRFEALGVVGSLLVERGKDMDWFHGAP